MSKRLLTATVGIVLGLMASGADARPYEPTPSHDFDRYYSGGDSERQTRSERSQRRKSAKRSHNRQVARGRGDRRTRQARRGGGRSYGNASAARGCLTPAARALLGRIEAQFGAMQIISTCRPGARIAGSGRISRHASGNAIDFNAGGRKGAVVRWLIANHKSGGTMTYAGMSHVHVDIGSHFVSLNSRSGG